MHRMGAHRAAWTFEMPWGSAHLQRSAYPALWRSLLNRQVVSLHTVQGPLHLRHTSTECAKSYDDTNHSSSCPIVQANVSARWCVCAIFPCSHQSHMVCSGLCQRRSQAQRVLQQNPRPCDDISMLWYFSSLHICFYTINILKDNACWAVLSQPLFTFANDISKKREPHSPHGFAHRFSHRFSHSFSYGSST